MNTENYDGPPGGPEPTADDLARRRFLSRLSIGLGCVCATVIGVPWIGFVVAPLFGKVKESWIPVGKIDDFKTGETITVPFPDPSPLPWAGITAKGAAWLRREADGKFTAFSVNCTRMGCPVRWLAKAELFMCPCHGGVYYRDGSVAAGPPPKPLVRYDVRVLDGRVELRAAAIPITTKL